MPRLSKRQFRDRLSLIQSRRRIKKAKAAEKDINEYTIDATMKSVEIRMKYMEGNR